jgi:hypothetical protein
VQQHATCCCCCSYYCKHRVLLLRLCGVCRDDALLCPHGCRRGVLRGGRIRDPPLPWWRVLVLGGGRRGMRVRRGCGFGGCWCGCGCGCGGLGCCTSSSACCAARRASGSECRRLGVLLLMHTPNTHTYVTHHIRHTCIPIYVVCCAAVLPIYFTHTLSLYLSLSLSLSCSTHTHTHTHTRKSFRAVASA